VSLIYEALKKGTEWPMCLLHVMFMWPDLLLKRSSCKEWCYYGERKEGREQFNIA
jgi:hypothetical protein